MPEDYFDFEEKVEEPEELSFDKTVVCPHCKNPIPEEALRCLYCGEAVYVYKKAKWVIWVVILVTVAFLALVLVY